MDPARAAAGCLAGALGAVLVQLVQIAATTPENPLDGGTAFALNCFAITGVVLLALLLLDVRHAVDVRRRTGLAAEPVAAP